MEDPVVTRSGQTYERDALLKWVARGRGTCPLTRKGLRLEEIITHHRLRSQIRSWKRRHGGGSSGAGAKSSSSSLVDAADDEERRTTTTPYCFVDFTENDGDNTEDTELIVEDDLYIEYLPNNQVQSVTTRSGHHYLRRNSQRQQQQQQQQRSASGRIIGGDNDNANNEQQRSRFFSFLRRRSSTSR